jgi:HAMP domain-containing protein
MTDKPRDIGIMGQIGRSIVLLILLSGLFIGGVAYGLLGRILREQFDQRAVLITMNLSDAAAGHVLSRDVLQLNVLLTKYARLSGVAYALIKDRHERVVAQSPAGFSPELEQAPTSDQPQQVSRRMLTVQGQAVYETQAPILEGQLGTAHVGVWAEAVESQVNRAAMMFMWPITCVLLIAVIVAHFLARRLVQPFRRLTDVAGRMSLGDLDTPVRVESQHEFGELTRSLERLRASLKAATLRLSGSKASELNT